MNLLSSLRHLLTGDASVVLTLSQDKGALTALIQPRINDMQPDTEDAELAALQAALSRPLRITFSPDGDPDAELANVLGQMAQARSGTVDALTAYREAQDEAKNTASAAKGKKEATRAKDAAKGKAATAKPAAAAKATTGGATLAEATAAAATLASENPTPASESPSAAPGTTGSIFD